MPPAIASIANVGDGQHLDVTLSAAPGTGLAFWASTLPGVQGGASTFALQAGLTYRIDVGNTIDPGPGPNTGNTIMGKIVTLNRTPIYVTAEDVTGTSDQGCWWICFSQGDGALQDWMSQWETAVQDILVDNLPAINAALVIFLAGATTFPNGQPAVVQKVLLGSPAVESDTAEPVIAISVDRMEDELYFGNPHTDQVPSHGEIYVVLIHHGETEIWGGCCRAIGMACLNVINQTQYLTVPLDCGNEMVAHHVANILAGEEWDPDIEAYVCTTTLALEAELSYGRSV
jgi:hypothetical protein